MTLHLSLWRDRTGHAWLMWNRIRLSWFTELEAYELVNHNSTRTIFEVEEDDNSDDNFR